MMVTPALNDWQLRRVGSLTNSAVQAAVMERGCLRRELRGPTMAPTMAPITYDPAGSHPCLLHCAVLSQHQRC